MTSNHLLKLRIFQGKMIKNQNHLYEVYRDCIMDRRTVSWWSCCPHEGQTSVQDDPRNCQPVVAGGNTKFCFLLSLFGEKDALSW